MDRTNLIYVLEVDFARHTCLRTAHPLGEPSSRNPSIEPLHTLSAVTRDLSLTNEARQTHLAFTVTVSTTAGSTCRTS